MFESQGIIRGKSSIRCLQQINHKQMSVIVSFFNIHIVNETQAHTMDIFNKTIRVLLLMCRWLFLFALKSLANCLW